MTVERTAKLSFNTHTQRKIMLNTTAYIAIDQIQSAKKEFVKTFIKNEEFAEICNKFVDTQAEYTKHATKLSIDSMTAFFKLVMTPEAYKVK